MGIKSIWDNPFYQNYKPLPRWCFSVNFENFILNKKDTYYGPTLSQAIQNCTWGKRETSVVKTYYAGMEANFPGRVQNTGELNITFNEDANLNVSRILEELFNGEISNDHYFLGSGDYIYNKEFNKTSRTIILQIHKPAVNMAINDNKVNTLVAEIEFHNCMLVSINEEEFNYTNTDEVLTKTARIAYDFMVWKRKKKFNNTGN
jgi:hypothetical protein